MFWIKGTKTVSMSSIMWLNRLAARMCLLAPCSQYRITFRPHSDQIRHSATCSEKVQPDSTVSKCCGGRSCKQAIGPEDSEESARLTEHVEYNIKISDFGEVRFFAKGPEVTLDTHPSHSLFTTLPSTKDTEAFAILPPDY